MSENEKARHGVAAPKRAKENGSLGRDTVSVINFITVNPPCQTGRVSSVLPHGRANAIPGQQLVSILGLKDLRELTQLVERERKCGALICATTSGANHGYYLAESIAEAEDYLRSLNRRLHNMAATQRAVVDKIQEITGQESIGGWYDG